jgi:menaquinone-dependent protoporphyrinogen oxidase
MEVVMRVLVAYGSKAGGTAGIAKAVGNLLAQAGYAVEVCDARSAGELGGFDGVVVGSSLYTGRWHADSLKLIKRLSAAGYRGPVWVFHSGPLGEDADQPQPLPKRVSAVLGDLDVRSTATFGGRLDEHPKGMLARAMARNVAGDYRDWADIARWTDQIATGLEAESAA